MLVVELLLLMALVTGVFVGLRHGIQALEDYRRNSRKCACGSMSIPVGTRSVDRSYVRHAIELCQPLREVIRP